MLWIETDIKPSSDLGLWSLIKRSAKSKIRRKTYEVDGPAKEGAVPVDSRAKEIAEYFTKYNYQITGTGQVITFVGSYQSSKSQALSLVLYTFVSKYLQHNLIW